MADFEPRPLHLHTLDSLLADLISGRPVFDENGERIQISDAPTRSALDWYRRKGVATWATSVSVTSGEDLVDAIAKEPPELASLTRHPNSNSRRLSLKRLEAHRFAGLHKFGKPESAPKNYTHDFSKPLTLFEGRNGSGKTSLLNAIIWALTGEILRPQREPEKANEDFECWVSPEGEEATTHKLSPVTPLPTIDQYKPKNDWVPADTWVELTFVDEDGIELPPIRRSQNRSARGKLSETAPDLTTLGIDPVGVRIGTLMPGLLPLIKVGSESELGRAVAQLTGLSALVDLTDHARRAKGKIDKEFIKTKTTERDQIDENYNTTRSDLENILREHSIPKPSQTIPNPSEASDIEGTLQEIKTHFENTKAKAFSSARDILGNQFDPEKPASLADLERNISRALERLSQPSTLSSAARLHRLRSVAPKQLEDARSNIRQLVNEALTLERLARDPSAAARSRLYARIAAWMAEHPDASRDVDLCQVCGGPLALAVDPVSGKPVKTHLDEAKSNADLMAKTLVAWAQSALGELMRSLPEELRAEISTDLPDHPCDLLRQAIIDELFGYEPFKGVLAELKSQTAIVFDAVVENRSDIGPPIETALPSQCQNLQAALVKLDKAIRFAQWRQENDELARNVLTTVLGKPPKVDEQPTTSTLNGKLWQLETIVREARPISDAITLCDKLTQHIVKRKKAEKRITEYTVASNALGNVIALGALADRQVNQLRKTLRREAAAWREQIYLGAFPDTAHQLVDTPMGRKGELDLVVESGGVSAPAQHVSNASALRASLVAFYFAFWEHVFKERGGLRLLLLDDPQELLDDENRERLATAMLPMANLGAQLILSSYDPRFCSRIARLQIASGMEHLEVLPATRQQPVIRTVPALSELEKRRQRYELDVNAEEPARDFADVCRVFLEAKLGDIFDDPAHFSWSLVNPDPTLATFVQRLRPLVKSGTQGMFSAQVFRRFVDHPAMADGSTVLALMNKSHHGKRQEIRAADVAQSAAALSELLSLAEQMFEESYRWRRRDAQKHEKSAEPPAPLTVPEHPSLDILICPDLAAFTEPTHTEGSQDATERLASNWLDNKVIYYLRRPNFGFAAPQGALAIAEAIPAPTADRRLVIARHGESVYARRFLRGKDSSIIGLTAEIPDPRTRFPKTLFLPESEVAIHQVVGIIFDHSINVAPGQNEAELVDASAAVGRAEIAFRVKDDSAVPLALEKQVVLGGALIELADIGRYEGSMVALALSNDSSIFKRVAKALPDKLSHLRQFESIGGLGASQILSVGKPHVGFESVLKARLIFGVLYHG